jgi:hypothetical protein
VRVGRFGGLRATSPHAQKKGKATPFAAKPSRLSRGARFPVATADDVIGRAARAG